MKKPLLKGILLFAVFAFGSHLSAQTYCTPEGTNASRNIVDFSTTNGILNISNLASGFSADGYGDFTSMTASHAPGGVVDFAVNCATGNTYGFKVWVDWNQNGTFEASEVAYQSSSYSVSHTGSITVPATALSGPTRMRIGNSYTPSSGPADPCATGSSSGEYEDYTFEVVVPLSPSITQSSGTPDCVAGTDLTAAGTLGTNETWYWQTTADGTDVTNDASTAWNVTMNGFYFVRTFDSDYSAWSDADSIEVTNIPFATAPPAITAGQNPVCAPGTDISVTSAPSGVVYYWQGTSGTSTDMTDDAATPYAVTATGRYYVKAYNTSSQCWSDTVGLTVTVGTVIPNAPVADPAEFNYCDNATSAMISATPDLGLNDSLATGLSSGGTSCDGGIMFDVTNDGAQNINITSFDMKLFSTVNPTTKVYYMVGAHAGSETTQANWTLLGDYPTTGAPSSMTNLVVDDLEIPAGATFGIFLEYYAHYTSVTSIQTYSNSDITITSGSGLCSAFGSPNALRAFNGAVHYTAGAPSDVVWYDAATGGTLIGTTNPFETVGTTVMPNATLGSYDFYAVSNSDGCESLDRTLVTVNINLVNVELDGIDASCDNGDDGSFSVASIDCGVSPFTFSVDGGTFGAIPTDLTVGNHTVTVKDANGDESAEYTIEVASPDGPSALTAVNISGTSADLGWTVNGSETSWNVEWGAPGFTPGTGTELGSDLATTNPLTATISSATAYEFYVQAECGSANEGVWEGPYAFDNIYCIPSTTYAEYLTEINTYGADQDISYTASTQPAGSYADSSAMTIVSYETQQFDINTNYSSGTNGVNVWVDWDNDFNFDASELIASGTGSTLHNLTVTIPAGTPVGDYRMRVRALWGGSANPAPCGNESWGSTVDFTLNIITAPNCLPVLNIDTVAVTTTSVELTWDENNSPSSADWIIEYGPSGFTQGTGTEVAANAIPFTVIGLNPSTGYDFYVLSDCGNEESSWRGPYSTYTACGIAVAPFYEGFNNGVQPQCWENLSNLSSTSTNNYWLFDDQGDYEAANNGKAAGEFAKADGSSPYPDSMMLITPEIDISQLTTPYLSFEWYSNNGDHPGDNNIMIVELYDGTTWNLLDTLQGDNPEWQFVNYDLTAYLNDIVQVRFMVNQTIISSLSQYNDILIDEVRIDDCLSLGGQDGSLDVCRLDNTVDLNDNIIVKPTGGGKWSLPGQESYISDSIFTVTYLPAGSYEVYYVERFVCYDTTVATINVFNASSAGIEGTLSVCKNEPINLFSALSGNVDLGGDWINYNNNVLPNSQPKAPNVPGQYNFTYIADNGVCPADTASVEVGVRPDCDFLSTVEEQFTDISVYPNPATSQLNIVNPSNTSSLRVEMLDMNGRIVMVEDKALNNASEATLAIDHLEKGIYTLRVYNNEGQKTFKIVKQ